MQVQREIEIRSKCEAILSADESILYSSILDSTGSVEGEAMKKLISAYDRLTVMVLPINNCSNRSVVIATTLGTDLTAIVQKTKWLMAT